jgi:hypothetical protein
MPGRLGPRFAIEALFLIALAVGAAYADLASKWIVLVMAGGWLVVALLELSADRIWAAAPPWRRPYYYVPGSSQRSETAVAQPPPVPAESEPGVQSTPELPLEPTPVPQAEAVTIIAPSAERTTTPPAEPEPKPAREVVPAPSAEAEPEPADAEPEPAIGELARPKLEPLEPVPKRRWFRRREHEPVAPEVQEIELPKHVRLLPAAERTDREVDELLDVPESEEHGHR